ncbi:hypothetical protein LJ707_10335 [Mucilaginibacter sp. UR6-1]|uniref:hypothetical protein n=1 Tax=Mucilaginibacter sp. UR6-1 TaxID=1435643 RepID=UPI001E3CF614|nr:hypothetical protein [Mucilaginibacter sp. UR6-1]MCC8409330.1 hypothetical protein [Mucilaginibacter sp. UR6-1]
MKAFIITCIALVTFSVAHGQTWSEWFKQNKTQKKYLTQQIAALKVYIKYAQKGYKIAKEGLTTIGNITNGEFNLHEVFFNSLRMVNPEIKNYVRVADIIALQVKIVKEYNSTYSWLSRSDTFEGSELDYIERSYRRLLENCEALIDELIAVTTDSQLEMKDDERMERINRLYTQMQENWEFCRGFGNESKGLAIARLRDKNDAATGRSLNDINPTEP